MYWEIGLAVCLILLVFFYFNSTKNYGSFEAKGYPEDKGYFPLGSQMFWDVYMRRSSFRDYPNKYRHKYAKDKFFIAWNFGNPVVVVLDVELAKHVLVKDFDSFPMRRPLADTQNDANKYFSNMMSVISDVEKWRKIRSMISPVFTSGKLKAMLPHLHESVDKMLHFTTNINIDMIDARNLISRYTTQSIAKAGFGVEADCFNTEVEEPHFMGMVNTITARKGSKWRQSLFFLFFLVIPNWMARYLPVSLLDPTSQSFFISMINQSIEGRRNSKVSRGDFVDLLLLEFYKNTNEHRDETVIENDQTQFDKDAEIKVSDLKKFDEEELKVILIANVFILLFAGFETTSSMMTVMLVYLANYPQIQEQLFEEISDAIQKNNGKEKLDYTSIVGMKYLDCFIHESLRHFPLATLERVSTKPYRIPGTDCEVDKGTLFIFPNSAFGLSDEHFDNPDDFDPNHFSDDEKKGRSAYRFLAFGHGPRNCIGMRFALLQIKTCLYRLVYNYKIVRNEKTVDEIVVPPTELNPDIKGGAWVQFEKRDNA